MTDKCNIIQFPGTKTRTLEDLAKDFHNLFLNEINELDQLGANEATRNFCDRLNPILEKYKDQITLKINPDDPNSTEQKAVAKNLQALIHDLLCEIYGLEVVCRVLRNKLV